MTVGEKIQYYRKKIGLSQEELGQKLFVSRQTVSLWEMDKTLPTVDNLIRLKEIFSVSVDDILSDSEPTERASDKPKETYVFRYEQSDLQDVFKKVCSPLIRRAIIFILCCLLLILLVGAELPEVALGVLIGCFLLGVLLYVKAYFSYRKKWKSNESRMLQSTYFYEVFNGNFVLSIFRKEESVKTLKIYFYDVQKMQSFGNYFVLQSAGQSCLIKKDALIPGSIFFALFNAVQAMVKPKRPQDKLKTVSIFLFVLSICTVFIAITGVAIMTNINQAMTENMWIFFLFLPIPIASVAFGFYLKAKGYKYKMNVIAGFIMAALLCVYGSFTFLFADIYLHSDEPILSAEQALGIDIPQHSRINTQDWTKGEQTSSRGYICSTSDIFFESSAVEEFEKTLSSDARWITAIPSDMVGITSYFCEVQASDYYIIYNKDTNEVNKLPGASGTYTFVNILYNVKSNTMKIVEYRIEYIK